MENDIQAYNSIIDNDNVTVEKWQQCKWLSRLNYSIGLLNNWWNKDYCIYISLSISYTRYMYIPIHTFSWECQRIKLYCYCYRQLSRHHLSFKNCGFVFPPYKSSFIGKWPSANGSLFSICTILIEKLI